LDRRLPERQSQAIKLEAHGVVLDRYAHATFRDGKECLLTPTEFRLLEALLKEPGKALTRGDLVRDAMGETTIVLDRTIDVHIRSLRHKLNDVNGELIETVRGIGYRFRK
jgi:two-component system phosphate regulon response regulator PhoB